MLDEKIKQEIHEATKDMRRMATFDINVPKSWGKEGLEHLHKILNRHPMLYMRHSPGPEDGDIQCWLDIRWDTD